jgi:hypothetical protein
LFTKQGGIDYKNQTVEDQLKVFGCRLPESLGTAVGVMKRNLKLTQRRYGAAKS